MQNNEHLPKIKKYILPHIEYANDGKVERCSAIGTQHQLTTINDQNNFRGYITKSSLETNTETYRNPLEENDCKLIHDLLKFACQNNVNIHYINFNENNLNNGNE